MLNVLYGTWYTVQPYYRLTARDSACQCHRRRGHVEWPQWHPVRRQIPDTSPTLTGTPRNSYNAEEGGDVSHARGIDLRATEPSQPLPINVRNGRRARPLGQRGGRLGKLQQLRWWGDRRPSYAQSSSTGNNLAPRRCNEENSSIASCNCTLSRRHHRSSSSSSRSWPSDAVMTVDYSLPTAAMMPNNAREFSALYSLRC